MCVCVGTHVCVCELAHVCMRVCELAGVCRCVCVEVGRGQGVNEMSPTGYLEICGGVRR